MAGAIVGVLTFIGGILAALWSAGGYSHRSRARRSILSELSIHSAMWRGDAKDLLKEHLDARVAIYLADNLRPPWIHPRRGPGFLVAGVAVCAIGVVSLFVGEHVTRLDWSDLHAVGSVTAICGGALAAAWGLGLIALARDERQRAENLEKKLAEMRVGRIAR